MKFFNLRTQSIASEPKLPSKLFLSANKIQHYLMLTPAMLPPLLVYYITQLRLNAIDMSVIDIAIVFTL